MGLASFLCLFYETWTLRGQDCNVTIPCSPESRTETWHLVERIEVIGSISFVPQGWQVVYSNDPRQTGNHHMLTEVLQALPCTRCWVWCCENTNVLKTEFLLSPGLQCGWRTETCAEMAIIQGSMGREKEWQSRHSRSELPNILATSNVWLFQLNKMR